MKNKEIEETKLVIFGTGGVGKSALVCKYVQGIFIQQYDPTLEDTYRKEDKIGEKNVILDILDTAGQEEFGSLRDQYIIQGEGYIVCYSLTNRDSLKEAEKIIEQILVVKGLEDKKQNGSTLPLLLVGTKSDLIKDRKVSQKEGRSLAEEYGIECYETSAKTDINVKQVFCECAAQVTQKRKKEGKKGCFLM